MVPWLLTCWALGRDAENAPNTPNKKKPFGFLKVKTQEGEIAAHGQ